MLLQDFLRKLLNLWIAPSSKEFVLQSKCLHLSDLKYEQLYRNPSDPKKFLKSPSNGGTAGGAVSIPQWLCQELMRILGRGAQGKVVGASDSAFDEGTAPKEELQ